MQERVLRFVSHDLDCDIQAVVQVRNKLTAITIDCELRKVQWSTKATAFDFKKCLEQMTHKQWHLQSAEFGRLDDGHFDVTDTFI